MKKNIEKLEEARAAKRRAVEVLSPLAPVVGIGITRLGARYGLKVNVEYAPDKPLPADIDGVPIRIEIVGRIVRRRAQSGGGRRQSQ